MGIAKNTYVIFTTDHGTPGRNPPLAGGKGTVSEGGLRVPFIIRGPGIQAGACSHVRAIGEDLFPTIAELAKVTEPLPKGIEGGSLAAVLTNGGNGTVKRPREEFVVHFPHYDKDAIGPASAILLGDFKLIRVYETGSVAVVRYRQGSRRTQGSCAAKMPDKAKELNQRLTDYLTAVDAQMPKPNPAYDPSKPAEPKARRQREGGQMKRSAAPACCWHAALSVAQGAGDKPGRKGGSQAARPDLQVQRCAGASV